MPMPGETLLIASALLASRGKMGIVPLLLTACIAAVTGDNIGYAIGRFGGRRLVLRYGRYVLITEERLQRAEGFFRRYGGVGGRNGASSQFCANSTVLSQGLPK